jgi:hypothetical protein
VVAVGMSVFFIYTGLEVSAGQWEASFCRTHLNLSATATGLATRIRPRSPTVAALRGLARW